MATKSISILMVAFAQFATSQSLEISGSRETVEAPKPRVVDLCTVTPAKSETIGNDWATDKTGNITSVTSLEGQRILIRLEELKELASKLGSNVAGLDLRLKTLKSTITRLESRCSLESAEVAQLEALNCQVQSNDVPLIAKREAVEGIGILAALSNRDRMPLDALDDQRTTVVNELTTLQKQATALSNRLSIEIKNSEGAVQRDFIDLCRLVSEYRKRTGEIHLEAARLVARIEALQEDFPRVLKKPIEFLSKYSRGTEMPSEVSIQAVAVIVRYKLPADLLQIVDDRSPGIVGQIAFKGYLQNSDSITVSEAAVSEARRPIERLAAVRTLVGRLKNAVAQGDDKARATHLAAVKNVLELSHKQGLDVRQPELVTEVVAGLRAATSTSSPATK